MKSDIDALMRERDLDAILVSGPGQHNPAMVYLTGGGHLTSAELVKKRGVEPVLFCNPMERDEAADTGLETRDLGKYRYTELLEEAEGDRILAAALRYQKIFAEVGLTEGRIAIEGRKEIGPAYAVFSALQRLMPEITIIGEVEDSVLSKARMTKDEDEIRRIRRMGQITTQVVAQVADFLSGHKTRNEILIKKDGQPLLIGEVKKRINLWLAERGAENPEGTILAIGRDAGVPHSSGKDEDALRLGRTIIFDIFPCEAGGGYYYDFTRTWCLGYAPDKAFALYEDVLGVYQQIRNELRVGERCKLYQERTCALFEARGHPTIKDNPQTTDGFVHGLGHGLGLNVHEKPWLGVAATDEDRLDPGVVVTIEPGLYYPDKGVGCRLEDSVWARPDGSFEVLADYPLDLVLPVE
ncbi:MAG: Xaa-Pro peptidase family protein [Chloroflexota bacterium]